MVVSLMTWKEKAGSNPRMKSWERAPELALLKSLFNVIHRTKGTTQLQEFFGIPFLMLRSWQIYFPAFEHNPSLLWCCHHLAEMWPIFKPCFSLCIFIFTYSNLLTLPSKKRDFFPSIFTWYIWQHLMFNQFCCFPSFTITRRFPLWVSFRQQTENIQKTRKIRMWNCLGPSQGNDF